jgi:outer membrane immunogenic protein
MSKYLVAVLLAGMAATPALAQESAPFSGPRIEGLLGYDRPRVEGDSTGGVVYGARVGYDFRNGGVVFGADGEISDSSADECIAGVTVAGDPLCASAGRDLYAGGRIGAVLSPNVMVYGRAGYTNARFKLAYDDGGTGAANFRLGRNLDGVRVGAGLEYAIGRNAFIDAEYRYSNYQDGFSRHQVLGGFGVRF